MTVSLYVRVSVNGKRRHVPVNKKKLYPDGTVFCLRYARKSTEAKAALDGAVMPQVLEKDYSGVQVATIGAHR